MSHFQGQSEKAEDNGNVIIRVKLKCHGTLQEGTGVCVQISDLSNYLIINTPLTWETKIISWIVMELQEGMSRHGWKNSLCHVLGTYKLMIVMVGAGSFFCLPYNQPINWVGKITFHVFFSPFSAALSFVTVMIYLVKLINPHSKCMQCYSMGWNTGVSQKEKGSYATAFIFLCFLTVDTFRAAASCSCCHAVPIVVD